MDLGLSLGLARRDEEEEEQDEVQLSLQPFAPAARNLVFPWANDNKDSSSSRGVDMNLIPSSSEAEDGTARAVSGSPNSTVSSFHVDFSAAAAAGGAFAGGGDGEAERASSRASDEEENGSSRKKLRLSKEQSAFLEESFKEHNTLNPKQKVALAKQLNLRPRQVEVWFQNRRARTKLKQTEVDCEYLKRCCETLTEENRRLQKELSELRALKTPTHPFYMQLPATTLSMCPSCERTTTTTSTNPSTNPNANASVSTANANAKASSSSFGSLFAAGTTRQRFYPFAPHPTTSPAS